jgi:trimeric autotransporter adhesin
VLAPATSSSGSKSVVIPVTTPLGTYYLLACADDLMTVAEVSEANNCLASATTVLVAQPDLVTTAIGPPPAQIAPGGAFTAADTVTNQGNQTAGAPTSRYYLSGDPLKGAGDVLLAGTRAVAALAAGAASAGTRVVTVPATTPAGTYYLLACADDLLAVAESDNNNNCLVSTATVLANPPAQIAPGKTFSITDTVANQGQATAAASTTRYYLSFDGVKNTEDVLLSGTRAVGSLAPGATSSGPRVVTVPAPTPVGDYVVLACADDFGSVAEADESNNCAASIGTVQVRLPDLAQAAVSNPPSMTAGGATMTVTDTVMNTGQISASATTTRYYLSLNASKEATDVLLTGTRSVGTLLGGASSTGSKTVTIPATIASGQYYLLACADDTNVVVESDEVNNCLASSTTTVIP